MTFPKITPAIVEAMLPNVRDLAAHAADFPMPGPRESAFISVIMLQRNTIDALVELIRIERQAHQQTRLV